MILCYLPVVDNCLEEPCSLHPYPLEGHQYLSTLSPMSFLSTLSPVSACVLFVHSVTKSTLSPVSFLSTLSTVSILSPVSFLSTYYGCVLLVCCHQCLCCLPCQTCHLCLRCFPGKKQQKLLHQIIAQILSKKVLYLHNSCLILQDFWCVWKRSFPCTILQDLGRFVKSCKFFLPGN